MIDLLKDSETKRIKLVSDLKEYCKNNPDNCEKEKKCIESLDPKNWGHKIEDVRALGINI